MGYGLPVRRLNYFFCSDAFLLNINKTYLRHHTLTDILTFGYSDPNKPIEADVYISIDRVLENAAFFHAPFDTELRRVMVHGLLHLCGLNDKSNPEEIMMRAAENHALELFFSLLNTQH